MKLGISMVLRNAYKHWVGTQAVGHLYDLFLGRFKPKKGHFW